MAAIIYLLHVFFCLFQGDIDLCGGDPNDGIDSDCSASSNSGKQVLVGICAMAKKAQSKPMTEILTRLREFDYIHMTVFEEDVILKVGEKRHAQKMQNTYFKNGSLEMKITVIS